MLKKLMKYDLIWIEKFIAYFAAVLLLLSLIQRGTSAMSDKSTVWLVIDKVAAGFVISGMFSIAINAFIRSMARIRQSLYKDEAYLTHTLPVSKSEIYTSKVLSALLAVFSAVLVIIISAAITALNGNSLEILKEILSNKNDVKVFISVCAAILLQITALTLSSIIGMIIGHRRNSYKDLFSVITAIAVYFAAEALIIGTLFACSAFNEETNLFLASRYSSISSPGVNKILIMLDIIYLIINLGLFISGKNIFKKGVNVE